MSTSLFWIAAALAALTFLVHVVAGGMRVMQPLLTSDLPQKLKGFLYLGWHSTSVAIAAIALGYGAAALDPARTDYAIIATVVAASFVGLAGLTSIKLNLSFLKFPVVPLFSLVAAIGAAGALI